MTPAPMRIQPMMLMSMPATVTFRANARIAPRASRKMLNRFPRCSFHRLMALADWARRSAMDRAGEVVGYLPLCLV
jgi:hypothetical protein